MTLECPLIPWKNIRHPRACCNWDDFVHGFLAKWSGAPMVLIDVDRAERDWIRHACTGAEAAIMQLEALKKDASYLETFDLPRVPTRRTP